MKDRGKAVEISSGNWFSDYCSSSDLPCKKHPSSSSVGICAYCLKDRLIKLVCSDCGEQRLSSCSCSDFSSSYRSSCTVEVGSVGRISFLIENEKPEIPHSTTTTRSRSEDKSEAVGLLKRSSSSSVDVKRSGFWRLGRFFRKKREKGFGVLGSDEKGETWVLDYTRVSRSRSVGGFRGGFDESESGFTDVNKDGVSESEKKSGGFNGGMRRDIVGPSLISETGFKGIKKGGFMEFDGDFSGGEDSGFIDLKLGFSSESKPEFSCVRSSDFLESESSFRGLKSGDFLEHESDTFEYLRRDGFFSNGSSCRITVNDKGIKKCRKSLKVWRWIFRHQSVCTARKKEEENMSSNPERGG